MRSDNIVLRKLSHFIRNRAMAVGSVYNVIDVKTFFTFFFILVTFSNVFLFCQRFLFLKNVGKIGV